MFLYFYFMMNIHSLKLNDTNDMDVQYYIFLCLL